MKSAYCSLLERQMQLLEQLNPTVQSAPQQKRFWMHAEDVFEMLTKVVLAAIGLVEKGYDVSLVQNQCNLLRGRLNEQIEQVNSSQALKYALPSQPDLKLMSRDWIYPTLQKPEYVNLRKISGEIASSHSNLKAKLNYCEFIDGTTCSAVTLLRWLARIERESVDGKCMLVLKTVEDFIFKNSKRLQDDENDDFTIVNACSPSDLYKIVEMYQKHVELWHRQPLSEKLLQTQHQSREVLVLWVSFCLVHQWCPHTCEEMSDYGISLQWQRLEVLVLNERKAMIAGRDVAVYIRRWNQGKTSAIFDLNDQLPTFQFGRAVAQNSAKSVEFFEQERTRLREMISSRWNIVQARKQEASQLRSEMMKSRKIWRIRADFEGRTRKLKEQKLFLNQTNQHYTTWEIDRCSKIIKQHVRDISTNKKRLEVITKMPPHITSSLPKRRDEPLQTIFFLKM